MIVIIDSGPDHISRRLICSLAPAHQGLHPPPEEAFLSTVQQDSWAPNNQYWNIVLLIPSNIYMNICKWSIL